MKVQIRLSDNTINFLKRNEREILPLMAFLLIFIMAIIVSKGTFLKVGNLVNIIKQSSYTGIIALGMTLVIISGGIDLSVGSMAGLVGGISILVLNLFGPHSVLGIVFAFLACLASGAMFGFINGYISVKGKIEPFIVTLGTMSLYRSLSVYLGNAGEFRSENILFPMIGSANFIVPISIYVFLILSFLVGIYYNNTKWGRYMIAVGYNAEIGRYSGIKIDLVKIIPYVITGVFVGLSTFLWGSRLNSVNSSNFGLGYELDTIAAVVIGGTAMTGGKGTILGTVFGALILGIINNLLVIVGISPYLQGFVKGVIIILAAFSQYRNKKI